jgi:sugar phosphate isomerase/epimerase
MRTKIGYCTNVHSGNSLAEVKQNLLDHAAVVRDRVANGDPLPVGLWLSAAVASELDANGAADLKEWLAEHRFLPYTFNGFPYSDFHQPIVKHAVYLPTWADPLRLDYTIRLAEIMAVILPDGESGTISTLPIGWPTESKTEGSKTLSQLFSRQDFQTAKAAGEQLKTLALRLQRIFENTGKHIMVCIEPEPGCMLDTADQIAMFFETMLFDDPETVDIIRDHIGVCHDICHSAVMFESQSYAINTYQKAGIRIGKIQVSSAVEARFESIQETTDIDTEVEQWNELQKFAEPRYLHQTSVLRTDFPSAPLNFEDLPAAIEATAMDPTLGNESLWRVHFHVPIFLSRLGPLYTTRSQISDCLAAVRDLRDFPHLEVETYAWNVLPERHQSPTLADGIAKEIEWLQKEMRS